MFRHPRPSGYRQSPPPTPQFRQGPGIPQTGIEFRDQGTSTTGVVIDRRLIVMPASYATGGHPVDLSAAFATIYAAQIIAVIQAGLRDPDGRLYSLREEAADVYASRRFRIHAALPRAGHTPTGSVSAPTFTGDAVLDHQHAAAGGHTPTGSVSAPTFTGDALPTHDHNVTEIGDGISVSGTVARIASNTGNSCVVGCSAVHHPNFGSVIQIGGAAVVEKVNIVTAFSAQSAGTPTGSVSAPTFTGDAVLDHQHAAAGGHTPTGSVSVPTFTGDPVPAAVASEVIAGTDLSAVTIELLVTGVPA